MCRGDLAALGDLLLCHGDWAALGDLLLCRGDLAALGDLLLCHGDWAALGDLLLCRGDLAALGDLLLCHGDWAALGDLSNLASLGDFLAFGDFGIVDFPVIAAVAYAFSSSFFFLFWEFWEELQAIDPPLMVVS